MTTVLELANVTVIPLEVPTTDFLKSVNFYLVQMDGETLLIDAGYDHESHWEHLQQSLQKQGVKLTDLTAILLTHHHIDHIGLVHRISKQTDIPVYVHPYALPRLKGDPEFLYRSYLFFRHLFEKLDTGDFGREQVEKRYRRQMENKRTALDWNVKALEHKQLFGFDIVEIPGHAPDQVGFYLPEEDIIFVGDLLIDHLRSNAFVEPDFDGKRIPALQQHIDSLKKIIALNPKIAFSGHGKVMEEPAKLAERRLTAIEAKAESFLSLIEQGFSTGREIAMKRHPDKYDKIFSTLMSDAMSFLDYMEARKMIVKKEKNGIWEWERA